MKRNQVNAILVNQAKKRTTILFLVCATIITFMLSATFLYIYIERNKAYYVNYNETSNIDYKVHLRENEFFKNNYLDENKQYIANLINYITANFQYKLSLDEEDVEYKYSYKVEAEVNVIQKSTNNSLYTTTEEIVPETKKTTSKNNVVIKQQVDIDYNKYNELIKRFVNIYSLEDTTSVLNINMYVNAVGSCEEFVSNDEKKSVITLSIPLTTKTTAIDLSNNLVNSKNNVMQCKPKYSFTFIFLVLSIIFAITGVGIIVYIIKYDIQTRTAENIYEKELKKILNNYSSYIQTLNSDFDFSDYQPLRLDTFNDMLEIRDTIRQPILMREKYDKSGAYFLIPSSTKILYVYRLKVSDIEKELQKKSGLEEL